MFYFFTGHVRIEHELREERVQLVVLHQRLVGHAQRLVRQRKLLLAQTRTGAKKIIIWEKKLEKRPKKIANCLQQEVVAEVPVPLVPPLPLRPHVVLEPAEDVVVGLQRLEPQPVQHGLPRLGRSGVVLGRI